MTDLLEVFVDESCKNGKKFLALGGVAIKAERRARVIEWIEEIRARYEKKTSEVKWSKVRVDLLPFYKDFVDVFFRAAKLDYLHYHALVVDTSLSKKGALHVSEDEQFGKLIYQLLLHKFGRRYCFDYCIDVYLDERSTKEAVSSFASMLNAGLCKITRQPMTTFNEVNFMPSERSNLIQLCDLLTGAVGTRRNGLHQRPDAAFPKCALGTHIANRVSELWKYGKEKFTIWNFRWNPVKKSAD